MIYPTRHTVAAVIAMAMFLAAGPAAANGGSNNGSHGNGLPHQTQELGEQVGLLAGQVAELTDAIAGLSASNSAGTPVQLELGALFQDGEINATETILRPMSYTLPEGQSMLIRFVSCVATRGENQATQFDIRLEADHALENSSSLQPLVRFVPTAVWESPGPFGDRAVASTVANAYVNIPSPSAGAAAIGDQLLLRAQRNETTGSGGVVCTIGGILFPRPSE